MEARIEQKSHTSDLQKDPKEIKTNHQIKFNYTKKMAEEVFIVPLLIAIVGVEGNSGQTCSGVWMPMYMRIPLVISGVIGLGLAGIVSLVGSTVTVPADLAVHASEVIKEKYRNYNHHAVLFKPSREESKSPQLSHTEVKKPSI